MTPCMTTRSVTRVRPRRCRIFFVAMAAALAPVAGARAAAFEWYAHVGTVELPAGAAAFDALTDGRLITILGDAIYIEDALGSGSFALNGTLPDADIASFGAAFLRVSPNGTQIAVGNNGGTGGVYQVGIFDVATLAGAWFAADHFDAAWADDTHLAITGGDFVSPSVVTLLDTSGGTPLNPVIIDGIGGASAGIAFDAAGNLYTGNGFSFGDPTLTGEVRAFDFAAWTAAAGGTPLNYDTDGVEIINVLSASPLGFDEEGNLYVGGGGDESDFVALARTSAVAGATAGSGAIDIADPALVRTLDPDDTSPFNFYTAGYNAVTGELLVRDYGATTVHRYAPRTAVPAMSQWGAVAMLLLLLACASLLFRAEPRPARRAEADDR